MPYPYHTPRFMNSEYHDLTTMLKPEFIKMIEVLKEKGTLSGMSSVIGLGIGICDNIESIYESIGMSFLFSSYRTTSGIYCFRNATERIAILRILTRSILPK